MIMSSMPMETPGLGGLAEAKFLEAVEDTTVRSCPQMLVAVPDQVADLGFAHLPVGKAQFLPARSR
jgi:hypothetical protein